MNPAETNELDRIADMVAARIRAQLGVASIGSGNLKASTESCAKDCTQCGHCVVRLEHDVRAIKHQGAVRFGALPGVEQVANDLAGLIDHTLLRADVTHEELKQLCDEANRYHFASVCINSGNVPKVRALLGPSTTVKICAVVGFPLGAMAPGAKAFEAREAVRAGAHEIDMVINIGALKEGDYALVLDDISKVVVAARPAKVKVILETGMLTDEQKVAGCTLSKLAGAHFVKTSTGFGKGGATAEDIRLMRRVVGTSMGVKASGGVRSAEDAERMVDAGASRIGASASVAIVTGKKSTANY